MPSEQPNASVPEVRPASARILIADDDAELREMISLRLSKLGYQISEVSNGAELIEALETSAPDLIISDLQMPILSGIEALVRLRRSDWAVPFILMTGFPGPTTHDRANRLGAAYILHKPLDFNYLCQIVQEVVGP